MFQLTPLGLKCKSISWKRILLGLAASLFIGAGASLLFINQEYTASTPLATAVVIDRCFDTPKATLRHFRNAVSERNWRDEYNCYSDKLKARFTYLVVICAREMSDSKDLAAKLGIALQKFRLPADVLDQYPSLRSDVIVDSGFDEQQREREVKELDRKRELQLESWSKQVYSRDIDWGGLIAELQPLYFENFQRHVGDFQHPSQYGIVWHFNCHTFDPLSLPKIHADRSAGIIIACRRDDPHAIADEKVAADDEHDSPLLQLIGFAWGKLWSFEAWDQGEKHLETISLVRLNDGWKIDAVPYR